MNNDNLRPPLSPSEARELGAKGGKASGASRRAKKTIADYLKNWGSSELNDGDREQLEKAGFGSDATKKTLLLLPLLEKAKEGNLKALEMIIALLGEDDKRETEIKLLRTEIAVLKAKEKGNNNEKEKVEVTLKIEDLSNGDNTN